ncbi:MAG: HAMP domain-containing sensor histidine kinase [Verrucomicrobiales bacterium]|nr:HAMP domain-containing sensor histidine kinase [Verrucomicrobiales bacterium]
MTSETHRPTSKPGHSRLSPVGALYTRLISASDRLIPESLTGNPEQERRARLLIRFGILGSLLAALFAGFYFSIGHLYGGVLVSIFTGVFSLVPLALKHSGNLRKCSNLYILCVAAGFFGLAMIEGGINGKTVVWLSIIPLCAIILTGRKDAIIWSVVSMGLVGFFAFWHLMGVEFPDTLPERFSHVVDVAGYSILVPFMVLIGIIFETARKRAFSQLETAMDKLTSANTGLIKSNAEKNEFLNIAAHDLKNPLSIITGFADLIASTDDLSQEETKSYAGEISKSANRMLDIVTNLLDIRLIEDGKITLRKAPCELADCVSRVHRDFEVIAAKKNITLRVSHRDPGATAIGDCGAISQILDNLVSNAIKYSPPGSLVTIRTMALKEAVGIDIIDEGPGLSEEDQANLFKKFSRLTPQPTGDESSNGLGLWIVDRIASSMGGKVFCKSVLNEGSTFSLRLPALDPSKAPTGKCHAPDESEFNRRLTGDPSDLILPN